MCILSLMSLCISHRKGKEGEMDEGIKRNVSCAHPHYLSLSLSLSFLIRT